jgi:ketosteroid isomerase-like protein
MRNLKIVEQVMDRVLAQDLESAFPLIAEDAELTVLPPDAGSAAESFRGRGAIREYFDALGGIVTFWELRLVPEGERVLVLGQESYTTNAGLESDGEFMLVCQLREGRLARLVVVENLAAEAPLLPTVFRDALEDCSDLPG